MHFVVSDVTALKKFNTVSGESFKLRKVSKKKRTKIYVSLFYVWRSLAVFELTYKGVTCGKGFTLYM